jgi:hypothetical protein
MHDPYELVQLYQLFSAEKISLYEVSNLVNNPRFDSPAV